MPRSSPVRVCSICFRPVKLHTLHSERAVSFTRGMCMARGTSVPSLICLHVVCVWVHRNMKSHDKKVRKAYAKFNPDLAQRLKQLTPTYKLDHLVSL